MIYWLVLVWMRIFWWPVSFNFILLIILVIALFCLSGWVLLLAFFVVFCFDPLGFFSPKQEFAFKIALY